MAKRRAWAAGVTLLSGLALASCSSDDNSPPAPPGTTVEGHFMLYLQTTQPTMSPEIGPLPYYFEQNGATLNGLGGSGFVSGLNVTFSSSDPSFPLQMSGTASGPTSPSVTGTFSISSPFNASGDLRLEPMSPTGMLMATGMLSGQTISVNSSVAIGQRLFDDVGMMNLTSIVVTHTDADTEFEIEFTNPTALMTGTLNPPALPVHVSLAQDILFFEADATGGMVDVTQYDPVTGFTATYSLTLDTGDTLTGSFDVVWDIEAYDP